MVEFVLYQLHVQHVQVLNYCQRKYKKRMTAYLLPKLVINVKRTLKYTTLTMFLAKY